MRLFFCCLTALVLTLGGTGCDSDSGLEKGVPKDADKAAPPPGMDTMKAKMSKKK
jgi:hypothetical protein